MQVFEWEFPHFLQPLFPICSFVIGSTCFPIIFSLEIRSYPDGTGFLLISNNGELPQMWQMPWPRFCMCASLALSLFPMTMSTFYTSHSGRSFSSSCFLPVSLALFPSLPWFPAGLGFFPCSQTRVQCMWLQPLFRIPLLSLNRVVLNKCITE